MSAIAEAAGTGMGTIYNYFPNKEKLINEIFVGIKQEEKAVFPSFDSGKPIRTQFQHYLSAVIHFFIQHPLYFKFVEQLQASPIITEESKMEGMKSIAVVLELIDKGQEELIIKKINRIELLTFIGGAMLSYLRWHFDATSRNDSSLDNLNKMVWDAIKE